MSHDGNGKVGRWRWNGVLGSWIVVVGMMTREKYGGIVWRPECMNDVVKRSDGWGV
jgi:hypothetical protein